MLQYINRNIMSQCINVIDTFLNVTKVTPWTVKKKLPIFIKWVFLKDICGMQASKGLASQKEELIKSLPKM
jgi:hypothetical protein